MEGTTLVLLHLLLLREKAGRVVQTQASEGKEMPDV